MNFAGIRKIFLRNDAKALLGQFNFKGNVVFNQVKQLSGGERARLAILRLILQPYNFLILDEPTNHMDMESKAAIECALNSYGGTVLSVSHDRRFLDMVADTIFSWIKVLSKCIMVIIQTLDFSVRKNYLIFQIRILHIFLQKG